jgi:hypothetical protein
VAGSGIFIAEFCGGFGDGCFARLAEAADSVKPRDAATIRMRIWWILII